ncbi:MAG: N-acetylmuramoyl-L-alanine amidase [Bacteroidales bacterium]|nr:N-acetylmuramoyl-L-alanine amidase [Bacteroidales bacterium]
MRNFNLHKNRYQTHRLKSFLSLILAFLLIIVNAQDENSEIDYKIHTVVIDPGHGGKDPGALGKRSKEKDIVLAISLKAGKYIEENLPDVKVIYTRDSDVFVPLDERAKIANDAKADLFISIHANSSPSEKAYGTETYAMGLHKTQSNLEVAKKENSVITFEENYETKYEGFDPDNIESYIMISIVQDTYLKQSLTAASFIQDQFRERVKRKDRGVNQAGFLVLWQTSMPSILVETGFISNENEEQYLMSEEGQDYLASAIYRAFRNYKQDLESKSGNMITDKSLGINTDNNNISGKDTLYFKVQITASSNSIPLSSELFLGFSDIEEFKANNIYKYAVGNLPKYDDIVEYSKWVKNKYPDAFIIAVKNGEIITIQQALNEMYNN